MTTENPFSLAGKVAMVTGGSSGIGAASVRLLAGAGARVVVGYNKGADRAAALIAELPGGGHQAMYLRWRTAPRSARLPPRSRMGSAAPTFWSIPPASPGWSRTATSMRSTTI